MLLNLKQMRCEDNTKKGAICPVDPALSGWVLLAQIVLSCVTVVSHTPIKTCLYYGVARMR